MADGGHVVFGVGTADPEAKGIAGSDQKNRGLGGKPAWLGWETADPGRAQIRKHPWM